MAIFIRLLGYLKPYLLSFSLCLGLVGLLSALELLKPWPIKLAVDQVIGKEPLTIYGYTVPLETIDVGAQLIWVVVMLVAVHFLTGFVQLLNNYVTIRIGQDMVQDFRCDLFDHLQRQSLIFHQNWPTGDLIYRIMGDTYAVQAILMNGVFTSLTSLALLIGMLIVLLQMDVWLTLCAVGVIPFLMLAMVFFSKRISDLSTLAYSQESVVYSLAERIFNSIILVQAFAREKDERDSFVSQSQLSFDRKLSLYSQQTAYGWIIGAITAAGTAAVLYYGVKHVLDGELSTGQLLVFISYLATLYTPLNNLSIIVGVVRGSMAQAKRVIEVMDQDLSVKEAPMAKPLMVKKGAVEFKNVSFSYTLDKPVLTDVNFACKGGSMVAIVGETGAGKTSLVSLLLRFYDPQAGAVSIDGEDLREVSLKSLRDNISIVLQETQLFPMSVHDNIAYGRKNASRDEVVAAAKAANAHNFIMELDKGYDTILGERGSNLSGGQRQRLSIARALLKNAPILILDEPTSALDAGTEAQIMEGLDRLMKDRTTFVIAHRLSMMRRADTILVIKDHHLAEIGNFEELLANNGEFKRLHDLQFMQPKAKPELDLDPVVI